MPVELVVPSVGESVNEVEIGDWLKKPGEPVHQDEPVVVLETDKVTVELPAPTSGTITSMLKSTGEKATVGDVIGYMETDGALANVPPAEAVHDRPGAHRAPLQEESKSEKPILATAREEQVIP